MRIVYCGQFKDSSGYGVAARGYLKAIDHYLSNNDSDLKLKIHPITFEGKDKLSEDERNLNAKYIMQEDFLDEEFIAIWHLPAPSLLVHQQRHESEWPLTEKIVRNAKRLINLAAWESEGIPQEWNKVYKGFNFDAIIAPSQWNKEVFFKSTEDIFCYKLPHTIEPQPKPSIKPQISGKFANENFEDKFVIFSMSQWIHRKGFDKLIKAYCSEFKTETDVALIIKTYGNCVGDISHEQEMHQNMAISHEIGKLRDSVILEYGMRSAAQMYFIPGILPYENISWLHEQSDLFALTTRGEGFGLTIAEALMHKKPVLVPDQGGHLDYIHSDAAFFVEGHWQPYIGQDGFTCDMSWYEPHILSIREQLRKAYDMWKSDRDSLAKLGKIGYEHIACGGYSSKDIGDQFYDIVEDEDKNNEPASIEKRINKLKWQIHSVDSLEEKIEALKDSFKGEICYLLTCGPSLKEHSPEYLREKFKNKLVFGVKQAYNYVPDCINFHFWNCSNLPSLRGNMHYEYCCGEPIVVASSNYSLGDRWGAAQVHDIFFKIPIRTEIDNEFLALTKKFDDHLLEKTLTRPCGPGIMLETVIPMAVHLGVSKIVALGWDLGHDVKTIEEHKHFFGGTEELYNRGDVLPWEIKANREASKDLYIWLKEHNIELELASKSSFLNDIIPRVEI